MQRPSRNITSSIKNSQDTSVTKGSKKIGNKFSSSSSSSSSKGDMMNPVEQIFEDPYSLISNPPYSFCTLEDHKRKKNCKGNPWCCYGLGEYKEGIWSKTIDKGISVIPFVQGLGYDISKNFRSNQLSQMVSQYSGLKNLGATCYMNVFLQVSVFSFLFLCFLYPVCPYLCI
jgi:hypothetical protein